MMSDAVQHLTELADRWESSPFVDEGISKESEEGRQFGADLREVLGELAEAKRLLAATEACVHTKLAELSALRRELANVRQVIDCLAEFSPEPASADPVAYAQRKIKARAYRFAADLLRAALRPAVATPDPGTAQDGPDGGQERENSVLGESS